MKYEIFPNSENGHYIRGGRQATQSVHFFTERRKADSEPPVIITIFYF